MYVFRHIIGLNVATQEWRGIGSLVGWTGSKQVMYNWETFQ